MSSSIFFRFKSSKDPLQITFDGTSLSVFEVKRDIIAISKLGDGLDFDLEIYTADTNEKYDDDTTQIPRSTTVIARRLPAARPGAGKAARYVTGKMPVNAKNAHRVEFGPNAASSKSTPVVNGAISGGKEMTEEEKMQAMLNASDAAWKVEQETMSHNKPVFRSFNKTPAVPDKPLPPGYICHRCGQKGHWIQACPTNNDPNFDNRPKMKRTTGIPRSMLKIIENPTEGEDGKVDISKLPAGVKYTGNGEYVLVKPDEASWEKYQEKHKASTEKAKQAAAGDQELRDRGLECPIDKRMFANPHKTPCCGKTYCFDCIEGALVESDLTCPNCGEQVIIDNLTPDDEMATKIKEFEDEKKAEKKQREREASKSPTAVGSPEGDSPEAEDGKSPAPVVSNAGVSPAASAPGSKKRAAESELPNDRQPSNPGAASSLSKTNSKPDTPASGTPNPTTQSNTAKPFQPPIAPAKDIMEFQNQMNAMAASMPGMQNGMGAMMNPMNPLFNPAMMGMNMPMNMGNMGNMGMMPGMPFPNMGGGGMVNMNGMNGMNNYGMGMMGNGGGWNSGGGGGWNPMGQDGMTNANGANDSPYMRQPVNPHRQRNRQVWPQGQNFRQF